MSQNNNNYNKINILIVDDEPLIRRSLSEFLSLEGYTAGSTSNGVQALELLKTYAADIVISDIKMPEMDGVELLRNIKKSHPNIQVILVTGYASIKSAVDAMKEGAYDYIIKPIIDNEIKIIIERIINQKQILKENIMLKEELSAATKEKLLNIIGKDPKMQKIYSLIEAVAKTRATVLIYGESGTGKRMVAHAIHNYDEEERKKPFVEVSCGALTETLLESELFGYVKGAFTGALKDRMGRFELADGGTIFLDEIDAFSPALQVKLLRVLQEGEFERVGDTKTIKIDIRIIAATNQNLHDLIAQSKFRKDLFYRLNIINIEIPPLRERKMDIPLLANDLAEKHAKRLGKKINGLSENVITKFMEYNWPGNVRELENVIERAIILCKGNLISLSDLPDFLNEATPESCKEALNKQDNNCNLKNALKNPERKIIIQTLESVEWNRNAAARALGINRTTLYKKMVRYELLKNGNGRKKEA